MNSLWIIFFFLVAFSIAYKLYGSFIASRIFEVNKANNVPSIDRRDDVDYIPTDKAVLFGHHFASIAGTGPIVGPAIAIIWGWAPALLWIFFGAIFAGAVHDFASLIISTRNNGASLSDVTRELVGERVQKIFFIVIFFTLWLVVSIFGLVIAIIFKMYPEAVIPVWVQLPVSVAVGWLSYKKGLNIRVLSIIAVTVLYISMFIGIKFPCVMPSLLGLDPVSIWVLILLAYAYVASVLPVWSLLQPRDYINSHQLLVGIFLMILGVFVSNPVIVAPVIQLSPKGAPPLVPFLFITITCGAISGFHSLVSSGTTSKQLRNETDAKFICFGGMLVEGIFAVIVIIAVAAGIGIRSAGADGALLTGIKAWNYHYSSWGAMQGMAAKVTAFVNGTANMLLSIGVPFKVGCSLVGVLVASFAGTTLDTATRIQRYVFTESVRGTKISFLGNRYSATFLVVVMALVLAFSQGGGKGALVLWPLFGTSNQLLAGLVLLIGCVYLAKSKKNILPLFIPMVAMVFMSIWATCNNMISFAKTDQLLLLVVGIFILFIEIWIVIESAMVLVTEYFRHGK